MNFHVDCHCEIDGYITVQYYNIVVLCNDQLHNMVAICQTKPCQKLWTGVYGSEVLMFGY